ncbi:kynureninase [Hymenobacter endophyticus]|uniref:Kynureninase n=1 Tax=Hymenobacter endophyticus TaxID=3076335 RepID=A0ABU3TH43_9BACT|nr:kynureninase [Hymenobacter endophyticus]MDU0370694.1 kynureninase [Hymenobacter endophyticus]
MTYQPTLEFARGLDAQDPLREFRQHFLIPPAPNGAGECLYFCGNSLGLQPRTARAAAEQQFTNWQNLAVEGHFKGETPWMHFHQRLTEASAQVVGAKPVEVVVMNNLTTNLHLLLVSFYQPTATRYKVLMEGGAFPSDQYALETQVRMRGLEPDDAIVELTPRPGEHTLRTEDILAKIAELGDSLCTIIMGGINYYTGQVYDMAAITEAGHAVGAMVGFDLAHAAGNIPLHLHDWDVDFACWCSYKYLNSGPGGVSGVFVHERFADQPELLRLAGWWGYDEKERFKMRKGFRPMRGAAGWQLSNGAVLTMAVHEAALAEHMAAGGMPALRRKSELLTGYLEFLIQRLGLPKTTLEIITPSDPAQRGCQLSLLVHQGGRDLFEHLMAVGVIGDWREPNVIRLAPVPLYNTFEDVYHVGEVLAEWAARQ